MSTYKTFAVWGAGNLGTQIAKGLLDRKASVIILSRPVRIQTPFYVF
jgi:Trk K+ transport system NAD-binding subunit